MSFEFDVSPKDIAATDFMNRAYKVLLHEALKAKKERGLTQRAVAELLETDKAVISRALSGKSNLTLRTIGEICWALGVEPALVVKSIQAGVRQNIQVGAPKTLGNVMPKPQSTAKESGFEYAR